jgi:ATP-dependent RNA helicase DeaD
LIDTFDALGLSAPTLAGLGKMGITEPTAVQAQAIPPLLAGRDALVQAPTGSGKTAAFVIPIVELCAQLGDRRRTVALVLCPTRELANQGADVADALLKPHGFRTACLIGGVGYAEQRMQLSQSPQIVFGSPGRVMDHIWEGRLKVDGVRVAVIDEADELLDQGFAPEVTRILSYLPSERQTILVSATLPEWVQGVIKSELHDPVHVAVDYKAEDDGVIAHRVHETTAARRFDDLCKLIDAHRDGSVIVFGRTKWGVQKLESQLKRAGVSCEALQGNMSQGQRDRALDRFREGKVKVLVATNVAARGIDVRHIGLVVNYELPETAELLTHRVGRTGRMGADGIAVTMITPEEEMKWRRLQRGGAPDLPRKSTWTEAEKAQAGRSAPARPRGRYQSNNNNRGRSKSAAR